MAMVFSLLRERESQVRGEALRRQEVEGWRSWSSSRHHRHARADNMLLTKTARSCADPALHLSDLEDGVRSIGKRLEKRQRAVTAARLLCLQGCQAFSRCDGTLFSSSFPITSSCYPASPRSQFNYGTLHSYDCTASSKADEHANVREVINSESCTLSARLRSARPEFIDASSVAHSWSKFGGITGVGANCGLPSLRFPSPASHPAL